MVGTLTSNREWFVPWKTIDGEKVEEFRVPPIEVLLRGMCRPEILLDLVRHFIVFEDDRGGCQETCALSSVSCRKQGC
jgi:type I restriction enzyme, R subunit